MLKRSTKVRVKSFEAIVINEASGTQDGYRSYRVSIKDPWTHKHSYWTVIPEELLEVLDG